MDSPGPSPSQHSHPTSPAQPSATPNPPTRKRKKTEANANGDDAPAGSEPRRLRRSHEACARCRSKKIKCDSKHPKCSACSSAGTPCDQEDRHRQTLTPRGHTERLERQVALCDALLRHYIPNFDLANIDNICASMGINFPPGYPFEAFRGPPPPDQGGPPKPFPYNGPPPPHMIPPGYHQPMPMQYGPPPPNGAPYPPHVHMQGPPGHGQYMYPPPPANPLAVPSTGPVSGPSRPSPSHEPAPGVDPNGHDMSNPQALAKNFGVSAAIVNDLKLGQGGQLDKEDLAVGSSGLISGRDRESNESVMPRSQAKWMAISLRRGSLSASPTNPNPNAVSIWLPKDRTTVHRVIDTYFRHLNFHRPVFARADFELTLNALYSGQAVQHDPGYVCSLYLILALGTLSELNQRALSSDSKDSNSPSAQKKLLHPDWPEHEEFFEQALAVKPDLRVTISSLQALILLHWYLYTERQGRTLWRLVGSLVRLSIELGLHHDPTTQYIITPSPDPSVPQKRPTFTEEECELRIRLWGIVMLHDRGTSILLGRPLAIAPSDSNTPRPMRKNKGHHDDFSEHFLLSHPLAEIQADIINSLYTPTRQSADTIMRYATRIIKSMVEFRRQLPESYRFYFSGTDEWPMDRRSKLVEDITEDQGLTLLKIGIARILLLRALFSSKELPYPQRHKALVDAIVTSHNIIVIHNQLIRFPNIAFFVSPIPLHIAAMVICFGHMSRCDRLARHVALEDVWMALDMLPRFRWRWERKDLNGGHPLIAKLAEKVYDVSLNQLQPSTHPVLIPEQDWDTDSSGTLSPSSSAGGVMQAQTPTMAHGAYGAGYGPQNNASGSNGGGGGGGGGKKSKKNNGQGGGTGGGLNSAGGPKTLAEVPPGLFYPFYPENPMAQMHDGQMQGTQGENGGVGGGGHEHDYNQLLAAANQTIGTYGCQQSQESYVLEEKDVSVGSGHVMWMNVGDQRGYMMAPQA